MNKRGLLFGYLVLVHVALALVIWKPDAVSRIRQSVAGGADATRASFISATTTFQLRTDANLGADAVLFFGDSHVQGLCVNCINPRGVNFGIGSETASELLQRIPRYRALETAHAVVLASGYNDLKRKTLADTVATYRQLMEAIPEKPDVVVSALFPIDSTVADAGGVTNATIDAMNRELRALCELRSRCTFVDITRKLADENGGLKKTLHVGDGVHLNPDGYAIWIVGLTAALN